MTRARRRRLYCVLATVAWPGTTGFVVTPNRIVERRCVLMFDNSDERAPQTTVKRDRVKLKPETLAVGDPQVKPKKELTVETMVQELREIQGNEPKGYCIIGTRHCSLLHQQIVELLSYALVISENHVYTSGASGTNAAAIRGALRAEKPELLTVVLPQSLDRQSPESQDLLKEVKNLITLPENDHMDLGRASRICNKKLIDMADKLIAFAYHDSYTVRDAAHQAELVDKIVTMMFLD